MMSMGSSCIAEMHTPILNSNSLEVLSIEESMNVFENADQPPSMDHFLFMSQKCRKAKNLAYARRVSVRVHENGLTFCSALGNHLVPMFVECGSLIDAQQVFDKLADRNVYSWTSLIQAYIEHQEFTHAFSLFDKMLESSVHPSSCTFLALIQSCAMLRSLEKGHEIHNEVVKRDLERDAFLGSTLVDMYAKCGSIADARDVFDELPTWDVVSWNTLLAGYVEHGLGEEALNCLGQMHLQGVPPDSVTFICSLKACVCTGVMRNVQKIHCDIIYDGFEQDPYVCNSLLDAYCKFGSLAEAQVVFNKLPAQSVVSWTSLLTVYTEHGLSKDVLKCLKQMQGAGVCPNAVTFVCSLKTCGIIGDLDSCKEIHLEIVKEGYEHVPAIVNNLVDIYAKCGLLIEAQSVFNEQQAHDVVGWTSLIAGHANNGCAENALNFLEQMQLEGVSPNKATFTCSLRACANVAALGGGREIHHLIVYSGFDGDPSLSNALVDMYAKCGSLREAQEVFDKLLYRDVVSWNTLITGYADQGLGETALDCLEHMHQQGILPDRITYFGSLKACSTSRALHTGQKLHMEIISDGFEVDQSIGNSLVHMYAKCGSLVDAREVFDELLIRDVFSWTALITGYSECGVEEEALRCLQKMQQEGVCPNAVTFDCSLKCCGSLKAVEKGLQIHHVLLVESMEMDTIIGSTLVVMYAKCGLLLEAQAVFDELPDKQLVASNALLAGYARRGCIVEAEGVFNAMPVQDALSWTALISGYADSGLGEEALNHLNQMGEKGLYCDAVVFSCGLKACGCIMATAMGQELHSEILKLGFDQDHVVGNSLVDMYVKCGLLVEARAVLDGLLYRDVVTWTAIIAGYADHGLGDEVLDCLGRMQLEGISPNIVTWNVIILGYAEEGNGDKAFSSYAQLQEQGVCPNCLTFITVLKACGKTASILVGKRIHAQIRTVDELEITEVTRATALIDMYGKCGRMVDAQQVFDAAPRRDLARWNALVTGYARQGETERVFSLFEQMKQEGISPDGITFLNLLTVCSHMGLVDTGLNFFTVMREKYNINPSMKHYNCVVDLLSRAGKLHMATAILEGMPLNPDPVTWRTLLGASQKWNNKDLGDDAFKCVLQMDEKVAAPFVLLSNVYADTEREGNKMEV